MVIENPTNTLLPPPALTLSPHDDAYPRSLRVLEQPPTLTLSGPLEKDQRVVAIVGSRDASDGAKAFAFQLAYHLARANVLVVSGGAKGIDREAHDGAIKGDGGTWVVACCGRGHHSPLQNEDLFRYVEASTSSRMIWCFPDWTLTDKQTPRKRNEVLVGLAECVIVIQARVNSGSRNAARIARDFGRRLFAVAGPPWDTDFGGSMEHLASDEAEVLWSIADLFEKLGLPPPNLLDRGAVRRGKLPPKLNIRRKVQRRLTFGEPPHFVVDPQEWCEEEKHVFSCLSMAPTQRDQIIAKTGLGTSSTVTALLTLSLKDVVVEGPDGFFRRRTAL